MNPLVLEYLQPIVNRLRWRRLWNSLAVGWGVIALLGLVAWCGNQFAGLNFDPLGQYGLLATVGVMLTVSFYFAAWRCSRGSADFSKAVGRIEREFPELNMRLATALEQRPEDGGGQLNFLQQEVVREAVYHDFRQPWIQLVPKWQLVGSMLASLTSFASIVAVMLAIGLAWKAIEPSRILDFKNVAVAAADYSCSIEPGDTEVEKGGSLLVLARFVGPIPPNVVLKIQSANGSSQSLPMAQSLNDPVCAARIAVVDQPLTYSVEYESFQSPTYNVSIFEYPVVKRIDAELKFPEFTQMSPTILKDVRRISAVEGTEATLRIQLNKPIVKADLISEAGVVHSFVPEDLTQNFYIAKLSLVESARYEVKAVDERERGNRFPPKLVITVTSNQIPKIVAKSPARDVQASRLEELQLIAETWDDFGLQKVGVTLINPGQTPREIVLTEKTAAKAKIRHEYLLALEELRVQEDDLLTYYFWAEDTDSAGATRRTVGEMYFVEIRPFDEIFRQGEQPTSGEMNQAQQGNAESPAAAQAENLAQTQKQIIAATWNLIRREDRQKPSVAFADDVHVIADAQAEARRMAEGLSQQVQDARSIVFVEDVKKSMDAAAESLQLAADSTDPGVLDSALPNEQNAYQNLLRLRAREHQVVQMNRQQQSQANSNQNSSQQQQMQQLEMEQEKNPYEEETKPTDPESPESRENRQVLNRLRELAQRQQDMNEQIRQLQAELEQAKEEQRAELERRLKRLQEEQQQILRDTDELRERMQNEDNLEQMSEQAQELEEARQNLQQSAESLENENLSQAVAEGQRAQEKLDELKNEYQRRNANQFEQEMKDLQKAANELSQRQQELTKELQDEPQRSNENPSLRTDQSGTDLKTEFREQQRRLEELRESMRETIERAEELEPLLAEELYDTYRDAEQKEPEKALDAAAQSVQRGMRKDAQQESARASETLDEIRQGVERAASRVTGDDAEKLRMAERELERLNQELADEMNRKAPANSESKDGERRDSAGKSESKSEQQAEGGNRESSSDKDREAKSSDLPDSKDGSAGKGGDEKTNSDNMKSGKSSNRQNAADNETANPAEPSIAEGDPDEDLREGNGDVRNQPQLNRNPNVRMQRSTRPVNPLSGNEFKDWSDRLRDVEEIVNDAELREEAARIRNQARELRKDMRERHSAEPNWELVKLKVMNPLQNLKTRVQEELLKKSGQKILVPLDRDPVPAEFKDDVERYYKELGSGK